MIEGLRTLRADNRGPFTLDGTNTHILGRTKLAVVDPGPSLPQHVDALTGALGRAEEVHLLLTHGHDDHAAATDVLLERLGAAGVDVRVSGSCHPGARTLEEGETIETDVGELFAYPMPGHTRDHLAFYLPNDRAAFVGDLLLGQGDTTWVAEYPGCVADYLDSLERLERFDLRVIFPGHGPPLTDPIAAIGRYRAHRLGRARQVREALAERADASADQILESVYADSVPASLRPAAIRSLEALIEYVEDHPG